MRRVRVNVSYNKDPLYCMPETSNNVVLLLFGEIATVASGSRGKPPRRKIDVEIAEGVRRG